MFGRRHKRAPSDGGRRGAQAGGDVRAMIAMGLTCLQRSDREQGLRWFAQASRTSDPAVLYDLGSFYASLHEPGRAEACFRRSAAGGSPDAMNALGLLLKNRGQLSEAERWLRQAAGLGDPHALSNLGNVLERQGDKDGAAQYWRRAAEAGLPQAMCSLGLYLVTRGEEQGARQWYERARAHAGDQPDLHGPLLLLDGLLGRSGAGHPDGGESPHPLAPAPAAGPGTAPNGPALVVDPRDPLGTAMRLRDAYTDSGDPAVLRLAIEFGRMAVAVHPPGGSQGADSRTTLGMLLRLSYERDRDPHHLAEAVTMGREGVAAAAPGSLDHPIALSSLACALLEEFEAGRDPAILAEAADLNRQAVRLAPPGHPELANWLSNLSNALLVQAMHTRDARLTDEAIVAGRAALHANVPGAASYPVQQANLGAALLTRFGYSRSRTDLDEAENLLGQSLAGLSPRHPGRPQVEANLEVAHHIRDLARAASPAAGPSPAPPGTGGPGLGGSAGGGADGGIVDPGGASGTGDVTGMGGRPPSAGPAETENLTGTEGPAGPVGLLMPLQPDGRPAEVRPGVPASQVTAIVAAGLTGTLGAGQAGGVTELVEVQVPTQLGARPKRPGQETASPGRQTVGSAAGARVDASEVDGPGAAGVTAAAGVTGGVGAAGADGLDEVVGYAAGLNLQYEETGDLATLTEAVRLLRDVLEQCAVGQEAGGPDAAREDAAGPGAAGAGAAGPGGQEAGGPDAAREGAAGLSVAGPDAAGEGAAGPGALERPGGDAEIRQAAQHQLGTALWSLFERTGDLDTLGESIALLAAAAGEPGAPADGAGDGRDTAAGRDTAGRERSRANLAGVLLLRGRYTGSEADLDRAVEVSRRVIAETAEGDPARGGRLATLASGLLSLGIRQQDAGLVTEAVAVQRAAVAAGRGSRTDQAAGRGSRTDQAAASSNMGVMLVSAYEFSHDRAAIDDAVRQCRAAVGATPGSHLLYPRFQANLSLAVYTRYLATQNRSDLAEAAGAARAAVAGTPGGHPNQAGRLLSLTRVLVAQYKQDPSPAALDELIRTAEQAAAVTPPGHVLWAAAGRLLAGHQALRAIRRRDPAELTGAAARLREIAVCEQAGVSERIEAAWNWAACLLAGGQARAALVPFSLAVELLPWSARRSLAQADQERPLSLFAGLASSAAACALAAGDPELGLRLLEQGRGILLGQALDARRDVSLLTERAPELAAEFVRLRGLLDPGPAFAAAGADLAQAGLAQAGLAQAGLAQAGLGAQRRHALAARWDALLAEIRARPGLADFLQPPVLAELRQRCTGGPVVIVNVSELRCDALIVDASGLRVVPLPRLSLDEAATRAGTFRTDLAAAWRPGPAARRISATLAWLWDAVTEPVLHALELFPGPENTGVGPLQDPPRVWWVPTGALAFLPLHAAGYHAQPGRAVIDLVVSSYLPTVRSLPEAATAPPRGEPNALAVAMPVTPGAADLPGARDEVDRLAALVASTGVLTGEQATEDAVLSALPKYAWAHFACHAASSTQDAGAARLLVHDHEAHPLTVREIARLRISGGELAYLSACGTAHGPVRLADEAVHITGAFLMAGYRHVIGTLWSVADQAAADVAGQVYAQLAEAGLDTTGAALALHRSVRKLRDEHRDLPARWAAHIHAGP